MIPHGKVTKSQLDIRNKSQEISPCVKSVLAMHENNILKVFFPYTTVGLNVSFCLSDTYMHIRLREMISTIYIAVP